MMRSRADRRSSQERAKKRAGKIVDRITWINGPLTSDERDRMVGKQAAVHNKGCSCPGCGNPRKHFSQKTVAEKAQDERMKEAEDSE